MSHSEKQNWQETMRRLSFDALSLATRGENFHPDDWPDEFEHYNSLTNELVDVVVHALSESCRITCGATSAKPDLEDFRGRILEVVEEALHDAKRECEEYAEENNDWHPRDEQQLSGSMLGVGRYR